MITIAMLFWHIQSMKFYIEAMKLMDEEDKKESKFSSSGFGCFIFLSMLADVAISYFVYLAVLALVR